MTKNINFVSHKKSKVKLENGKPQLPLASALVEGEIAVNYAENVETLSIKNESGTVVTFSSDNYYKEQYLAWEKGENVGSAKLVGNSGITSGDFTISEGYMTVASGQSAHAEGQGSSATSFASHAEGLMALASGMLSHAEGNNTMASGAASHAEGVQTSATNMASHAEGLGTLASGDQGAHAEGVGTLASGGYGAHAEGLQTSATSMSSHAEGLETLASGDQGAHAEGYQTIASGSTSHAEGDRTKANAGGSHAEGGITEANGTYSHAEGWTTFANGSYSHTEGGFTQTNKNYSHAEGYSTFTINEYEHASGRYNNSVSASTTFGDSGNTLFSVGNGTTANTRHNAFEIRQNGDIYIVNKAGQDVKLQDEIGNITVDQVIDETTSASTNPVATKAVYDAITDNELVWANAFAALSGVVSSHTENATIHVTASDKANWNGKLDASAIADFFDDAKYEDSGSTKVINFYHGSTIKATIDATDFIVDGMIDDVRIENGYLVIDFNTESGKQDIQIPLTDIFDPSNYYNKAAIDTLVGSGFTSSSITDVIIENEEIISAALTDLDDRKLDASAYTPTDLSNYYQKSETSGKTEIATALSGKANTATTIAGYGITDAYTKSETSGKTELSTAFAGKSDTSHTHASSAVTSMEGYAIAASASSISTTDTLMQAIGKLEKRIALLEAALIVQNNGDVYGSGGDYES